MRVCLKTPHDYIRCVSNSEQVKKVPNVEYCAIMGGAPSWLVGVLMGVASNIAALQQVVMHGPPESPV